MNTRILASIVLAVAATSSAQAQTELPGQWVDQQMKAAQQEQLAKARAAADIRTAAALPTTTGAGAAAAGANKTVAQK